MTSYRSKLGAEASTKVASFFRDLGLIYIEATPALADHGMDGEVLRDGVRYVVEVKALSEGRTDRAIPLLCQAILEAQVYARRGIAATAAKTMPMAVLYFERTSQSVLQNIAHFLEKFKPHSAIAIISADGASMLRWDDKGPFDIVDPDKISSRGFGRIAGSGGAALPKAFNLFSDLNQWMLKVLLAPEIREDLLQAPRQEYSSGSELASAANCSQMSASRLLQQLHQEGFLEENTWRIGLVRRRELFDRWKAAAMKPSRELPMRFSVRIGIQEQLKRLLRADTVQTCLGLFSAGDALGIGHVSGVPPYVYVPKLPGFTHDIHNPAWAGVIAFPHEAPDFVLRQASTPESTFKAAVRRDGALCADVIQVWLDVSNHPSRGQEQADHIFQTVLQPLISKFEP